MKTEQPGCGFLKDRAEHLCGGRGVVVIVVGCDVKGGRLGAKGDAESLFGEGRDNNPNPRTGRAVGQSVQNPGMLLLL